MLGFYGALDDRVNKTEPAARAALEKAGLAQRTGHRARRNHAFFNDTNADRYNATAAEDAWRRVQDWFGKYVV